MASHRRGHSGQNANFHDVHKGPENGYINSKIWREIAVNSVAFCNPVITQSVSLGAENATDPGFRKKSSSKGLKQRGKALNDVKNTIHYHASNHVESSKKSKNSNKEIFGKSKKITDSSKKCFSVLQDENEVKYCDDEPQPELQCINHFICEKANDLHEADFLNEYKLTEKELDCFSNRKNFFSIDPVPLKMYSLSPIEDVELKFFNLPKFDDEDVVDDISIDVPEPCYL